MDDEERQENDDKNYDGRGILGYREYGLPLISEHISETTRDHDVEHLSQDIVEQESFVIYSSKTREDIDARTETRREESTIKNRRHRVLCKKSLYHTKLGGKEKFSETDTHEDIASIMI